MIIVGDCTKGMRLLGENSVHAIVTDPPYGLGKQPDPLAMLRDWLETGHHDVRGRGFMGKRWDAFVPQPATWKEAFRVLKPGGYLLAFGGARTHDLVALGLRIAGFELRDTIMWIYGSGFPKGTDRDKIPDDWEGWNTALKPAHEPIIVARKPLIGTLAENLARFGTGALNIDGCRVTWPGGKAPEVGTPGWGGPNKKSTAVPGQDGETVEREPPSELGRWPANVIHDGSEEVLAGFPAQAGASAPVRGTEPSAASSGQVMNKRSRVEGAFHCDTGSAARFFYCAKATKRDRDEGLEAFEVATAGTMTGGRVEGSAGLNSPRAGAGRTSGARNFHPTVKPTPLMRYLVRLVTPPGGTVLDPYAGSGSTGKACVLEGFEFVGIEQDHGYAAIANARIAAAEEQAKEKAA